MDMRDELTRGRESYRRQAWAAAYQSLLLAEQATPLDVEDLELLATSAYLSGREDEFLRVLERAHQAHLHAGQSVRAARCAFWVGLRLFLCGEMGRGTGWLARAQRLLAQRDCVEQGYLLLPAAEQRLAAGRGAAAIGERFSEVDLIACARHVQGRALIHQGQVQAGLTLLDEAMVAVTVGELSPIMTGLI